MTIEQLREEIKQVRSNNQSLASLLEPMAIDTLVGLFEAYANSERVDELKKIREYRSNRGALDMMDYTFDRIAQLSNPQEEKR